MKELSPNDIFNQFSEAMYQWNLDAIKMKKENTPHEIQSQKLQESINEIYEKYLTKRKRTYGRQNGVSFRTPPEYNPETNEILSVVIDEKKAYIEVQETIAFKSKLRYTLHKKEDGWKLDKREIYNKTEDKWEAKFF